MGISLFGLTPAATYPSLIKFGDNSAISGVLRALSDGLGTDLPIQVSTAGVNFTGTASIGGTAIITNASGISGAIQFSNGSAFASDASNLFWDDTNNRLGIGTATPTGTLQVKGSGSTSATTALLVQNSAGSEALRVYDDRTVVAGVAISAPSVYGTSGVFAPSGANGVKWGSNVYAISSSNGILKLSDNSDADFNRLQFGGTTSSFPAIKKASNNIEIRNADDTFGAGLSVGAALNASAILQADSTTKGFLPPRMTTTQRDAIVSPATGLKIYNTTLNTTDTYDGAAWQRFGQQTFIKGSGSTSATTSLLVQNSAGVTGLTVFDNGNVSVGSSVNSGYQLFGNGNWFNNGSIFTPLIYTSVIVSAGGGSTNLYGNMNNFKISTSATATASAVFEVDSTTKGFLPPRMTTTQRDAIVSPATGLKIYNTTLNTTDTYDGAAWQRFGQQTFIKGSGSSSATTSLLVQNSAGNTALEVKDNLAVGMGAAFVGASSGFGTAVASITANYPCFMMNQTAGATSKIGFNMDTAKLYFSEETNGATLYGHRIMVDTRVGGLVVLNNTTVGSVAVLNASAVLQADSTTRGFLPPRMTTTQKNAIASPSAGLIVFDNTVNKLFVHNGVAWEQIQSI